MSSDRFACLQPYQIVYDDEEFLGAQVTANHPKALPRLKKPLTSSNSLAVPIVAAKCNDLINHGIRSYTEIMGVIKKESLSSVNGYKKWHQGKGKTEITIPHLCFVADDYAILDKCYAVVLNGLYLYTGKVGYIVNEAHKRAYGMLLLVTWAGNLAGAALAARAVLLSRIDGIREAAAGVCRIKLNDRPVSILILSFFCGLLMFIAVDGFREKGNPLILFLCVSVFILCGFEHCVANMFYFTLAEAWSVKAAGYLLIMTLGNSLGGMLVPAVKRLEVKVLI